MQKQVGRSGRPRSEQARESVLHAVDDLLVEAGYAAMTMKGIAERAGVGRQTVYRWWSTKAEILFEAGVVDAEQELAITPTGNALDDLTAYLKALARFLTRSAAGAAYRALLGEAQHDRAVAELLAGKDVLTDSARAVLVHAVPARDRHARELDQAAALLVGPLVFWLLSGHSVRQLDVRQLAEACLGQLQGHRPIGAAT